MTKAHPILARRWLSPVGGHLGVVAVQTGLHDPDAGEWKAYIGHAAGWNEAEDEQFIANWGEGLEPQEAAGFFPQLDITKYKQE